MAQFLRPDGTIANNGCDTVGAATLHDAVNESSASDSSYIGMAVSIAFPSRSCELSVSNPSATPSAGTCTIRYRYRESSSRGGGPAVKILTVGVYEGGVLVQQWVNSGGSADVWNAKSETVTGVTNWDNVSIQIQGTGTSGSNYLTVSWVEIEVPDGTAAAGVVCKVSNGTAFEEAAVSVSNGTTFDAATPMVSNGTTWDG